MFFGIGKPLKRNPPLSLPPLNRAEITALKLVYSGKADESAQKLAIDTIIRKISNIGTLSFDANNDSATAFAEGKRCVGIQLTYILTEPYENLINKGEKQ